MKALSRSRGTVVREQLSAREHASRTVAQIKRGLSVEEFDALRELLGVTVEALAKKVGISVATLSRRRRRHEPLDLVHGDRIVRFARLFRHTRALYDGNDAAARRWLTTPARALGGHTPLEFADTEAGAHEVEDLVGRLEHGVYT
jgi:putative toxin-antitoxin system antitoxin component (TIGR02293 family)